MTKRHFASLAAATLILSSASAFAASAPTGTTAPAPQATATTAHPAATAAATPSQAHALKLAAQTKQKNCQKEWSIDLKAGKLKDSDHKDFMAKCIKGA